MAIRGGQVRSRCAARSMSIRARSSSGTEEGIAQIAEMVQGEGEIPRESRAEQSVW